MDHIWNMDQAKKEVKREKQKREKPKEENQKEKEVQKKTLKSCEASLTDHELTMKSLLNVFSYTRSFMVRDPETMLHQNIISIEIYHYNIRGASSYIFHSINHD